MCLSPIGMKPQRHHLVLLDALEKLERGDIPNLMVAMPPGAAKSTYANILFSAWYMVRNPRKNVISASHTGDLAEAMSKRVLGTLAEFGPAVGVTPQSEGVKFWQATNGSGYKPVGVGGPVTGRRADCITGDAVVSTERGPIALGDIARMACPPRVLSFNHAKGETEYRAVVASRNASVSSLSVVTMSDGTVIRATDDHKIYVRGRGYIAAAELQPGDECVSESLPGVRGAEESGIRSVPAMRGNLPCPASRNALRSLRRAIQAAAVRAQKAAEGSVSGLVLRQAMSACGDFRSEARSALPGLRRPCEQAEHRALRCVPSCFQGETGTAASSRPSSRLPSLRYGHGWRDAIRAVLLERMPVGASDSRLEGAGKAVRVLQSGVSAQEQQAAWAVLQQDVQGSRTRGGHGRQSESGLAQRCESASGATSFGPRIPQNKAADIGEGRSQVRSVLVRRALACAPYRHERFKQQVVELGNALRALPSNLARCGEVKAQGHVVALVERVCGASEVFDIQVEGNHNFFANGILVHNCVIIDDPVKSRAEAHSPVIRDAIWNWYLSDLNSRLRPGGKSILIMTRWHEDDLAGRLLETEPQNWHVLRIRAESLGEGDDPLGRPAGAFLWDDDPDYGFGGLLRATKEKMRGAGSMSVWQALYQQEPRPDEGGLFQTHKAMILPAEPASVVRVVRAWDLAATVATRKHDTDWTVGVKLAELPNRQYAVLDVVRFRGGPEVVESRLRMTAELDGPRVEISLPQDPGQAGKSQAAYLVRVLSGFRVIATPESGDKAERAMPVASQFNAGNVGIVSGAWTQDFINELDMFPSGKHDDQIDALSRAFNHVAGPARGAKFRKFFGMAR